ncbi:PadR family transcriptional regulator [Falsibacillus pallidus]|uniref:DNA-binding PadR family transcriptional regulator n=1 Tax=Falsibacillus pallidus TaxID=493781 RepID=A0A370GPL7_9BACI|nr:PadR family transcriptional regulator [Falsibacillus pallidus]RDI45678.1 DNA-binding PadR family transcriptional regulator [Falsibacillus pallidus]
MSLDYLILGFLSMRPATGYEIKTNFEQKVGILVWGNISYGNLYPKLKKLEENGLIYISDESGDRNKKVYDLTGKGWIVLDKWMGETPEYPVSRDELVLKMIFWGVSRPNDKESLIRHLRAREVKTRELLHVCDTWREDYGFVDEYGALAFEFGQDRLESELAWLEKCIKKLESNHLPTGVDRFNMAPEQKARKELALNQLKNE